MGEDVIEQVRKLILERGGLYFKEHEMPSLKDNIDRRMAAIHCPGIEEYYNLVTQPSTAHREFTDLLNLLTVKHSHFFRNPKQFMALRDRILPEIMERNKKTGNLSLNILSAGCATGEEPYSIAMVTLGISEAVSSWKIAILATDINTEALVFAKEGVYPQGAVQYVDKDLVSRYMEKFCLFSGDKIRVGPAVKRIVDFQYMNLTDEFYPKGFDIIFCRNVTIYFEEQLVRKVIERFYQSLNEEGYLFTGGTESLRGISDKFELMDIGGALVYRKISTRELGMPEEKIWPWKIPATGLEAQAAAAPEETVKPAKSLKEAHELYKKAKENFLKKDYGSSIGLARGALKIEPHLEEARILLANIFVNQDKFEEAKDECLKAIDINFLSAEPRYLLGLIYRKQGRQEDALDNLKKAIYLNSNYSLAYFTLADFYREQGRNEEALRAYKNTLKALKAEPEEHFGESSGGIGRDVVIQLCTKSIKELSRHE